MLPGFPAPLPATGVPGLNDLATAALFNDTANMLYRTADLVGNVDGKTLTFSLWFRFFDLSGTQALYIVHSAAGNTRFALMWSSPTLQLAGVDTAGGLALVVNAGSFTPSVGIWYHFLASVDLTNTSKRSLYINDVANVPAWANYVNSTIDFTDTNHTVGNRRVTGGELPFKGNLAHAYIDYTYRDLSIEANRRLFNNGAGLPSAGQELLNPILYLKMTNPAAFGANLGTGGNFTVGGTLT